MVQLDIEEFKKALESRRSNLEKTNSKSSETKQQQTQTVKYCRKCGNMLELEDEFCDKCGSGQKKMLATDSTGGQQKMVLDRPQIKPTELWYLAPFFFGIIGGLVG
jgi:ribosomal protein L37E